MVLIFLFSGCERPQKDFPKTPSKPQTAALDSCPIYHSQLKVIIPIKAKPVPWKTQVISFQDTCHVIALLVDKNNRVRSGDLLASVWNIIRQNEFTPIDIHAQIEGVVSDVNYGLQDKIPPVSAFIVIKDFRYLLIRVNTHPTIMRNLKKGSVVSIYFKGQSLQASILKLDSRSEFTEILIANQREYVSTDSLLVGQIDCGMIKGDFILQRYFNDSDTLSAFVDPDFPLLIKKIAVSDTLAMIFPALPEKSFLKIKKNYLDL